MSKRDIAELIARISKATKRFEKKEKKDKERTIKPRNLYKLFAVAEADALDDAYFVKEVVREATKLLAEFSAAKDMEVKHDIHYMLMRLVNDPSVCFEPELTDAAVGFYYFGH
jgi:hypothetical protein